MRLPSEEILAEHYAELAERPFFKDLMAYVGSGPVVCMCWQGREAVGEARRLIGATNPRDASIGSIRGDYGQVAGRNVIHGSDSVENASKEIALWFSDGEDLMDWEQATKNWIYDLD